MERRRSAVVMFGDPNGEMFAVSERRVLPNVRGRWRRWREKRVNRRQLPAQLATVEEVRAWLNGVLGDDGSVASCDLDSSDDSLTVIVKMPARSGVLAFLYLRYWPDVEPRDKLMNDLRDAVRSGTGDTDSEFWLDGYAEECEMNRRDPTLQRKQA